MIDMFDENRMPWRVRQSDGLVFRAFREVDVPDDVKRCMRVCQLGDLIQDHDPYTIIRLLQVSTSLQDSFERVVNTAPTCRLHEYVLERLAFDGSPNGPFMTARVKLYHRARVLMMRADIDQVRARELFEYALHIPEARAFFAQMLATGSGGPVDLARAAGLDPSIAAALAAGARKAKRKNARPDGLLLQNDASATPRVKSSCDPGSAAAASALA